LKCHQPARDEVQPGLVEAFEERPHVVWREHVQVGRIVLRTTSEQEAQPILEPVGIRHRGDEGPGRAEHTAHVGDNSVRIA
jgi:hypothetical protein